MTSTSTSPEKAVLKQLAAAYKASVQLAKDLLAGSSKS